MTPKIGDKVRVKSGFSKDGIIAPGTIWTVDGVYNNGVEVECMGGRASFLPFEYIESVDEGITKYTLPTDSKERKNYPLFRGLLRYFPAALAGVSRTSKLGNDKHNPGEEMHHARNKSSDHGDCVIRHLMDVEDLLAAYNQGDVTIQPEHIINEVNQMAWRALAFSQELHEKLGAPIAPGAK